MKGLNNLRNTLLLGLVGIVSAVFAVILAGGGHGLLQPMLLLFPLCFLFKNDAFMLFLIIFQYAFYGFMIDIFYQNHKIKVVSTILIVHFIFVALAFKNTNL